MTTTVCVVPLDFGAETCVGTADDDGGETSVGAAAELGVVGTADPAVRTGAPHAPSVRTMPVTMDARSNPRLRRVASCLMATSIDGAVPRNASRAAEARLAFGGDLDYWRSRSRAWSGLIPPRLDLTCSTAPAAGCGAPTRVKVYRPPPALVIVLFGLGSNVEGAPLAVLYGKTVSTT